jgi:hypothetical protein
MTPDVFTQQIHRLEYMLKAKYQYLYKYKSMKRPVLVAKQQQLIFNLEDQIAHLKELQDARNRK